MELVDDILFLGFQRVFDGDFFSSQFFSFGFMASVFAAVGSPTTKGTLKLDELEKGIAKTMPEAEQFAKAEGSTALSGLATALDSGLRKLVSFWGMDQPARRCFVLAVLITAGHISWQESSQPKAKAKALITDGDKVI